MPLLMARVKFTFDVQRPQHASAYYESIYLLLLWDPHTIVLLAIALGLWPLGLGGLGVGETERDHIVYMYC